MTEQKTDTGAATILSLCSGYGGLELGLLTALGGGRVVAHAEIDPDASKVLAHHWPDVPNLGDIKTTEWTAVEPVDWLTAGYPCQPFSAAGKRLGEADERHLWPAVADCIRVLRPRRVLLENVAGHLALGFGRVLADLAALGYDTRWVCLRAADAGAPHGRARIFVVASDTDDGGSRVRRSGQDGRVEPVHGVRGEPAPDPTGDGRDEGRAEPARLLRGPDAAERDPAATDTQDADGWAKAGERCGADAGWSDVLPAERTESRGVDLRPAQAARWGDYAPAIHRWERITGRPAPRPTEPGRTGERLAPAFVEWMMGLPAGHVTGVGLTRNAALKCLGNGVVPQQAALALTVLGHNGAEVAA